MLPFSGFFFEFKAHLRIEWRDDVMISFSLQTIVLQGFLNSDRDLSGVNLYHSISRSYRLKQAVYKIRRLDKDLIFQTKNDLSWPLYTERPIKNWSVLISKILKALANSIRNAALSIVFLAHYVVANGSSWRSIDDELWAELHTFKNKLKLLICLSVDDYNIVPLRVNRRHHF